MSRASKPSVFSDRRRRILQTAFGLFAATPYHEAHVDAIAATAGVAKPTLYRYFATKEALFIEALEWGLSDLRREIEAVRSQVGSTEQRLRRVVRLMLDRIGRLSPAIRAVESQSSELGEQSRRVVRKGFGDLQHEIGRLLTEGVELGEFGPVRTDLAVLVVLGGVRMAAHATDERASDLADAVTELFLNGLRAREDRDSPAPTPESLLGVLT